MNRLAITRVNIHGKLYIVYILMDERREMVDFQLFDESKESLLNLVVIGRVENIVTNINAAFIKISSEQKCYLPLEDLKSPLFSKKQSEKKALSIGDELVVQVVKDAVKTKDPVVSTKLTLAGKYTMLTTDNTALSISKKIVGEKREALLQVLNFVRKTALEYGFGVILRTNSSEVSVEEVEADLHDLMCRFIELKMQGTNRSAFSILSQDMQGYIRKLKSADLKNLDGIYTDEVDIYESISTELPYLKEQQLLWLYDDKMVSLKTLYHIEGSVDELLNKKVWLKSGANIIIEQLETMTVIDVNSGKNMSKNGEALLIINQEAAVEIARQLRLRNISGMVLIDFINMKTDEQMWSVVDVLKEELKKDPVPANFLDVTKLGLVEVTRKKTYRSLKELVT